MEEGEIYIILHNNYILKLIFILQKTSFVMGNKNHLSSCSQNEAIIFIIFNLASPSFELKNIILCTWK